MTTALLLAFALQTETAVDLRLNYAQDQKESHAMDLAMKLKVDVDLGGLTQSQSQDAKVNASFNLLCKKAADRQFVFEVGYDAFDTEVVVDDGEGPVTVTLKGKDVVVKSADGTVAVDSAAGINPEAAEEVLKEMSFIGVKDELTLDDRGLVKVPVKDARLKELFKGVNADGIFPLILPDKAVRPGDEWTHPLKLEELGTIKLSKPVEVPVKFKLEKFEGEGDARVAVISQIQDSDLKGLEGEGSMAGVPGTVKVKATKMLVKNKGTSTFSVSRGRIVKSDIEANVDCAMKVTGDGLGDGVDITVSVSLKGSMAPK